MRILARTYIATAAVWVCVLSSAGCLRHRGAGVDLDNVPTVDVVESRRLTLGEGIIAPYRLLWNGPGSDRLYVLTGRGETFSEGYLHAVDPVMLVDIETPIDIGPNGADMLAIGQKIVIASRGTRKLLLVDALGWRIIDELELDFIPVALEHLGDGRIAVASVSNGSVLFVDLAADSLTVRNRVLLETFAYDVVRDGEQMYVVQPLRGVEVLETMSPHRRVSLVQLPGEPSRGAMVWNEFLVVPDRDGYLHFIDRNTLQFTTLDVAPLLALDRSTLAVRGIDPGAVIDLQGGRFLLINARQDSLLFESDPGSEPPVRVIARLPGGAFGAHIEATDSVYITQASLNAITQVSLGSVTPGTRVTGTRVTTGREIAGVKALDGEQPGVLALDSMGRLVMADVNALIQFEVPAEPSEIWRAPLATAPDGGFIAVAQERATGRNFVVQFDRVGAVVARYPLALNSIFSAVESRGEIVIVSRVNRQLQFIDLRTGESSLLRLSHDRPRSAARVSDSDWVVIHDTHPDIGITLIRNGAEESFSSFSDWYVGVVATTPGRALAATFGGTIVGIERGRVSQLRETGVRAISDMQPGLDDSAWVTSESAEIAFRVTNDTLTVDRRLEMAGIRSVIALEGTTMLAANTLRYIDILDRQNP